MPRASGVCRLPCTCRAAVPPRGSWLSSATGRWSRVCPPSHGGTARVLEVVHGMLERGDDEDEAVARCVTGLWWPRARARGGDALGYKDVIVFGGDRED